jgi:hypothetical protein
LRLSVYTGQLPKEYGRKLRKVLGFILVGFRGFLP